MSRDGFRPCYASSLRVIDCRKSSDADTRQFIREEAFFSQGFSSCLMLSQKVPGREKRCRGMQNSYVHQALEGLRAFLHYIR